MDDFEQIYNKILESIPHEIDLGFIPVKNEATKSFHLENLSKHNIQIMIESNDIIKFNLEKGVIPKLQKFEIKLIICPQNAIVSVGNARIIIGEEKNKKYKIIKISFISKYPYLRIQKSILDFGNVLIGKTLENEIVIANPEKVSANFFNKRKKLTDAKTVEEFFVSDIYGMIPPNSQFLLKVKSNSSFANHIAYETFEIFVKGGNIIRFSCIANSLGIRTNISEKFVNFQSVELNSIKTKMIRLFNESSEPTNFQFFYNNEGVFHLDELQGTIPANSNVRIRITFRPIETVMYYERIFCITKNHFLFVKRFLKVIKIRIF